MKKPPTATGDASVGNDRSHPNVSHIASRPRRASRLCLDYAALAKLGEIVETKPRDIEPKSADVRSAGQSFNLIPCKVVVERLPLANLRLGGRLDFVDLPGLSARKTNSRIKSTVPSDLPPERFSNVTKRTKPRRTGIKAVKENVAAEKQRHTISIVGESHGSIITLDESTDSSKVLRQRRNTQNSTTENGPSPVRRGTTRNKNTTSEVVVIDKELEVRSSTVLIKRKRGRPPKRQNVSTGPGSSDVSPPKKVPEHPVSLIELSLGPDEGTVEVNAQPAVQVAETPPAIDGAVVSHQTSPEQPVNNPFRAIIVQVKRIVPALTEAGLTRLKYPELEATLQEPKRSSAVPAGVEKRPTTILPTRRPSRLTLSTKPQIVISAPIAEDPDPAAPELEGPPKVDANSNNLLQPGVSGKRGAFNKKPPPLKPPFSLPLLIEEEGEGSGDVYEFLSLSQTSGESVAPRKNRGRKPKQTGEKKQPVGRPAKKKPTAPRAATRKASRNPFGCNGKQLARTIRNIGGGRVKSPTTTAGRYVVNLDLPETPREPASSVGQRHIIGGGGGDAFNDFPFEAAPPSVPLRASNPTVERLKNGSALMLHHASTPINRPGLLATPETPPMHKPASPWRLQDDTIVPRTAYMPRNRDMLPSYESLASEVENNLPRTSFTAPPSLVTERRKLPQQRKSSVDTSTSSTGSPPVRTAGGTDFPGGIISEKNFREIERMYGELEATSELSRNLISSMRRYKATLANNPNSPPPDWQEYESNMRGACAKLRQWYERSIQSMNRSIRIINRMHQAINNRPAGRPPPLSTDQQRTMETLSHSTDRFRTLIDELQVAMNDSNLDNRSPPSSSTKRAGGAVVAKAGQSKPPPPLAPVKPADQLTQVALNDSNLENRSPPSASTTKPADDAAVPTVTQSKRARLGPVNPVQQPTQVADIIELPNRTNGAPRKPLVALNFVPLPQRSSPLLSPLAKTDAPVPLAKAANQLPDPEGNIRRELQYDQTAKESMASSTVTIVEPPPVELGEPGERNESIPAEQVPEVGANEVVEMNRSDDQPDDHDDADAVDNGGSERDLFGFEEDISVESSQVVTQVTLPMPLNISAETLKRRLQRAKRLIPKRSIFRKQLPNGAAGPSSRSSGPTRLPVARLRVFSSPTKRPHTLREFIASTPRSDMSLLAVPKVSAALSTSTAPPLEAPDVSAIESNETVVGERPEQSSAVPEVVLFDTPEESKINRSAHQRTYARIPKRRKKINIYLANVGLDDSEDDDEDEDDPLELSSDTESEETKKRKKKAAKKKTRRKPKPVEETKEFKEFVEEFNSMCEEVNRFEVIIE
uniref:Uncharacterized protein n=1 Tax=Anopheles atroparvus TaxID=41427 RepID=A0AAG5CQR9_ANOAO